MRLAAQLLGAHVGNGADHLAGLGQTRRAIAAGAEHAGDAEVHDLRAAFRVDHDVCRLQVAVDHAALVRMLHAVANLDHQAHARVGVERARIGIGQQVAAAHQLHRQERNAGAMVAVDPGGKHVRDVRVVEQGERLAFQLEATQCPGIVLGAAQHLERHLALRVLLLGQVHRAHAATSEQAENAELADLLGQRTVWRAARIGGGVSEQHVGAAGRAVRVRLGLVVLAHACARVAWSGNLPQPRAIVTAAAAFGTMRPC